MWVVVGGVLLHKAIYLIHKRSQTLQASARARVGEVGRLDSCPLFTNREVAGTRLKAETPCCDADVELVVLPVDFS